MPPTLKRAELLEPAYAPDMRCCKRCKALASLCDLLSIRKHPCAPACVEDHAAAQAQGSVARGRSSGSPAFSVDVEARRELLNLLMANDDEQHWNAAGYAHHARFVADLGRPLIGLLDPKPGESILDLGCGDGILTAEIQRLGARVIGVDRAEAMVDAARKLGINARLMDGQTLNLPERFDAVFSNAALHWMPNAAAVVQGVRRHLKAGGRFVGEMGGHGNVAAVVTAILAVLDRHGIDGAALYPWYFPTAKEYGALLESHDFVVTTMQLIPRPTPLPTGIEGWLTTFAGPFLNAVDQGKRDQIVPEIRDLLKKSLCDRQGRWTADYVRLRFAAHRLQQDRHKPRKEQPSTR